MASEQDAKNAIRKAYIKDQTKFKSAFDHDFTKYKNDLADEFAESERYNKTPKGKAELEAKAKSMLQLQHAFQVRVALMEHWTCRALISNLAAGPGQDLW